MSLRYPNYLLYERYTGVPIYIHWILWYMLNYCMVTTPYNIQS